MYLQCLVYTFYHKFEMKLLFISHNFCTASSRDDELLREHVEFLEQQGCAMTAS